MKEIKDKQESNTRRAQFDFTDEQCLCCPKCRSEDIEPLEGLASWEEGRFWQCGTCNTLFEVRQVAREVVE